MHPFLMIYLSIYSIYKEMATNDDNEPDTTIPQFEETTTTTTTTTTNQDNDDNDNIDIPPPQPQQPQQPNKQEQKMKLDFLYDIKVQTREYTKLKDTVYGHMESLRSEDQVLTELINEKNALTVEYRQHEQALNDIVKDLNTVDKLIQDRRMEKVNIQKQIDVLQEGQLSKQRQKVNEMRSSVGLEPLPSIEIERDKLQSSYLTKRLHEEIQNKAAAAAAAATASSSLSSSSSSLQPPTKKRPGRPPKNKPLQ
ncbi:hypothetical protein DFA_04632 [Cavenderia fasciculata]|uniref:Uncharacterized protein n=1 Tax=Cavenderia fasciculata TaxID=261658 RepID=F4PQ41_CACFS|nr:uncharacterized protein DFA_04632 [Cavenderia fasciculata]EGG22504.1 hypothetical protein DFA_04632 [Cavenderia fasciculata]|eukprot:XP_004360355.1 hypothetical protein DFA_04632 [Cavenderia fasciculata]